AVAAQAVEQRLLGQALHLDGVVGVPLGVGDLLRGAALAAEAALIAGEDAGTGGPQLLAVGGDGLGLLDDHRRRALVLDLGDPRRRRRTPGGRDGAVQPDGLAAVDHLG